MRRALITVESQTNEYNNINIKGVKDSNTLSGVGCPSFCSMFMPSLGAGGSVTFHNVPPRGRNNYPYVLRVVGVSTNGVRRVIRRRVRPGELKCTICM